MLVYANHFSFQGSDAEGAVFKAIGGWLKEQLGFGLHPDQMRREGEFTGYRGETRSWLRVYATDEDEPALYAWVLKFPDETIRGRQWISELGLKRCGENLELSCVTKTDENSTLAARSPVAASRPRVISYVVNNIRSAKHAALAQSVSGIEMRFVGQDVDSYRKLLAEMERRDRDCPLILVSPDRDGEYLFNVADLQEKVFGIGQVVQVCREFNSYEMAGVMGEQYSAWNGAVNVLYPPAAKGFIRNRLFLSGEIIGWGGTQHERASHLLAWVTNNTNASRLRKHIRPEGVMQLSLRRRMHAARAGSEKMDAAQLRLALEDAARRAADQEEYFKELVEKNSRLETQISELNDELSKRNFKIQSLQGHLANAGSDANTTIDVGEWLDLVSRTSPPSPLECINLIEKTYSQRCIVLETARKSAEEMDCFLSGRQLLDLLKRLVTTYFDKLMEDGDNEARKAFGKNEYAAKESETVMKNKAMRRQRTFKYEGKDIEMFRHVKIGVDDDVTRTIRVHFHWDAERKKIVIGYCGKHLSVASH